MQNKINITLNNKNITATKGETILDIAKANGIEIPTLCHDPRLEPFSSCYICVVEVSGMRGLQPACSTKITEGMTIVTNSQKIDTARKTALELLLSNHYADCAAPCKQTCPAGVDVQGYISYIEKGMFSEAVEVIKETNPLPAVCGRVCVRPCEVACRRNLLDEGAAVGIDYMKRFAADYDLNSPNKFVPKIKDKTGKKVAVIGSGPGGLAAAFFLQKEGHQTDIYEAAPKGGGWLRYGIPEYRLPNDILQKEIDNIAELGVNIFYNKKLGENLSYKELKTNYDAVILAIGSQKGTNAGCEGDDAENVFSGVDFLKQMELTGQKTDFSGKTVAVIGGGNTAMDCCRTAVRFGAKKVYVVYRRTEKEMPANPIEIHESKLEGVEYLFLTAPVKINKDDAGKLKSMTCIKMELGEPDSSGRRRPVPVEGSETTLELDYILAAIGQKTIMDFTDDVNAHASDGVLKPNKWGDIDADRYTLQTGVKSMFACGDGVTGPATLIEAIGQARIAAKSCHLFLSDLPVEPCKKEFLSKKDNFTKQVSKQYAGKYEKQLRQEMPVLDVKERHNFNEVELGYASAEIAKHEAHRCLECGCVEYYDCDLKKYATQYNADQKKFEGSFGDFEIDFRHPHIEIDNNKCILCARCVRICKEVVGAGALGLVKRGFDTFVAPAMGESLQDTPCESCGMCISTCPTGAITENFPFKPGPVKLDVAETICNYCSVGCSISLHHKNGFVMKVTGREGLINKDGNLCKYPKFGYHYINDTSRITKPLLKVNGKFEEISFEKAYDIIAEKIKSEKGEANGFFAGARLTNEELYLLQKLARAGAGSNNITSFHYLAGSAGYLKNHEANVPFEQIQNASRVFLIGSEINVDNAVAGFMIQNQRHLRNLTVEIVTNLDESAMEQKADSVLKVKSYYHFIRALNYYYISKNELNALFIKDRCEGFEAYKNSLMSSSFDDLLSLAGVNDKKEFDSFADRLNNELNAVIVYSEKELTSQTCIELQNLSLITGKHGKTAMGLLSLKSKNNSQGLFDMGIHRNLSVGGQSLKNEEFVKKLISLWKIQSVPAAVSMCQHELIEKGLVKNYFIFGEDPIGCSRTSVISEKIKEASFVVVQDAFMTETAKSASLVLPASFHFEIGGSFSNTQRVIQQFDAVIPSKIAHTSLVQIQEILGRLGFDSAKSADEIFMELVSLLPQKEVESIYKFEISNADEENDFQHGCDSITKYFDERFYLAMNN